VTGRASAVAVAVAVVRRGDSAMMSLTYSKETMHAQTGETTSNDRPVGVSRPLF